MSQHGPEQPRREGNHAAERLRQFEQARYGTESSPLVGPGHEGDDDDENEPGESTQSKPDDPPADPATEIPSRPPTPGRD